MSGRSKGADLKKLHDPIVIASYARTPIGAMQCAFSDLKATELVAVAVRAPVERSGADASRAEQAFMGCVLSAGLGQAPARQAVILCGLGEHVQATTVNKMCGSEMQAEIMAHDALAAGTADIIVAGGWKA